MIVVFVCNSLDEINLIIVEVISHITIRRRNSSVLVLMYFPQFTLDYGGLERGVYIIDPRPLLIVQAFRLHIIATQLQ